MVLAALVPLALSLAADFFIVIRKITDSASLAAAAAAVALLVFFGCWFAFSAFRRAAREQGRSWTGVGAAAQAPAA